MSIYENEYIRKSIKLSKRNETRITHGRTKLQLTRDTKVLPKMKINPNIKNIFDFTINDFELKDYEYHPHIKGKVAI